MLGQLAVAVGLVVFAGATFGAVFLVGIRVKVPLAVDTLRRISRLFNARQMRTAGRPGAYASVIRYRGRRSGRPYETPVGAVETDDGFVIALPYGRRSQWVRNVLASGSAEIVHEGHEYRVDRPELIALGSVATRFSASDQRSHRLFGVDQCLRLREADTEEAA